MASQEALGVTAALRVSSRRDWNPDSLISATSEMLSLDQSFDFVMALVLISKFVGVTLIVKVSLVYATNGRHSRKKTLPFQTASESSVCH